MVINSLLIDRVTCFKQWPRDKKVKELLHVTSVFFRVLKNWNIKCEHHHLFPWNPFLKFDGNTDVTCKQLKTLSKVPFHLQVLCKGIGIWNFMWRSSTSCQSWSCKTRYKIIDPVLCQNRNRRSMVSITFNLVHQKKIDIVLIKR